MSSETFTADQLAGFASSAYIALGLSKADAETVADSLVQADLWGHQSHGVMRTFWYAARIQSGATDFTTPPSTLVDGGAIAVIDGNHGIGQVVAREAMDQAIRRAKEHGIGAVAVRNSGHFGTAMYFTRRAAMQGCVGFLSTNASPAMAPWGGKDKLIGNNPWSIAAPAGKHAPMILDIANTVVARGKLYLAKQRGKPIPLDWAMSPEGLPTTDPAQGILGNILPLAGHKGYAISTMMDVLSGVLTGSRFADDVVGPYMSEGKSGVGHLALALNIEAFRPLQEFERDMEDLVTRIKRVAPVPGTEEIFYPGEIEARCEARLRKTGIAIPLNTVSELDAAALSLGIASLSSTRNPPER